MLYIDQFVKDLIDPGVITLAEAMDAVCSTTDVDPIVAVTYSISKFLDIGITGERSAGVLISALGVLETCKHELYTQLQEIKAQLKYDLE